MSNGRNLRGRGKTDSSRDGGGFVALPWSVLDCPAYADLSHPARSLLVEFARQYVRDNNGRLLASARYLRARGWKSADVITRAKQELMAAGFIHETVKGHRPNRASWYALTWYELDRIPGYDPGATLVRSAYKKLAPKNTGLSPSAGVATVVIAPSRGIGPRRAAPPHGAVVGMEVGLPAPSPGNHLDMPSAGVETHRLHDSATLH